ncbi:enoyl-CoA hydratase/isomerase family protein [Erythrobacter sp. THAF29]|uniref:enoyl-CoA hydratase/isomerase family protein n=1 Tax=Erythrobacter sp. THAF29 TaxID=2587851 RepID=UPI0018F8C30B|nr:enoyl-CoA hydratase/isomerase family protein [Erythrobacter sp. THAF29]
MAEVTFDRGDDLNALSVQAMEELKAAADLLSRDTSVSAVLLTGGAVFSAGADLGDPALRKRSSMSLLEQREAVRLGPDLCEAWARLEQITIAAIEGFCIGGGLALAVSCDHRVASQDAHFRLPEVPLGMNMSWRSIPRIVALIGPSRAKELVVLGQKVEAEKALAWGLVDRIVGKGEANDAARALARDYCAVPPIAARMAKEAIEASAHSLAYATSFMDRDQFLLSRTSKDHEEAVRAFSEKRAPKFGGD